MYCPAATLVVQLIDRQDQEIKGWRVGFTASKRVGNAVRRNRSKRRLREAVEIILKKFPIMDYDIVIIAKTATVDSPYEMILRDLTYALTKCLKKREQ